MALQPIRFVFLSVMALILASGCKDDEKCTKARNAASDSWKAITLTAGTNKVTPNIGLDELPADKKGEHVETWGTIEKQSELISSSFLYDKITWNTADPALKKTNAAFDGYFAKAQFRSFDVQLKDANEKFKTTSAACRE